VLYDPQDGPELGGGVPLRATAGDDREPFKHQLLGTSRDIQGPVLDEVAYWFDQGFPQTRENYSESELRGEGWELLAQFGSSQDLMFGDGGDLYYVIPSADLHERRFDRVMGIMQCS
jgi:uncharacterized protein YwqG